MWKIRDMAERFKALDSKSSGVNASKSVAPWVRIPPSRTKNLLQVPASQCKRV
jgi:hypothetical protein